MNGYKQKIVNYSIYSDHKTALINYSHLELYFRVFRCYDFEYGPQVQNCQFWRETIGFKILKIIQEHFVVGLINATYEMRKYSERMTIWSQESKS